jgi:hypothetical protein
VGTDLVSACIFCASVLLRMELMPPPGLSAEIAGAYSTVQRRYDSPDGLVDISNVTPKFVLVGLRKVWAAPSDLGAGTPAREWRARIALGPSHDDQRELPEDRAATTAFGTGRFENSAVLYRHPVGVADSIEAGWLRRRLVSTDAVSLGSGGNYTLSEQRILAAKREDVGLGWRHRFAGLELALSGLYEDVRAGNATAGFSGGYGGHLLGGGTELRWRRGRFTVQLQGDWTTGRLNVTEQSFPDFTKRSFTAPASFQTATALFGYAWPKTDVSLSYIHDRNKLPFTAFAILGVETNAEESGFHSDSVTNLSTGDLRVRTEVGAGIRVYLAMRATLGNETVVLTDSAGVLPSRTLQVRWRESTELPSLRGNYPSYVIAVGAEFSIGASRP